VRRFASFTTATPLDHEFWRVPLDVFGVLSARSRELIVKDRQIDCLLSQVPRIVAGVTIIGKAMEVVDPHS
jgi:hypothetical protein